jgi:hypothetical protein
MATSLFTSMLDEVSGKPYVPSTLTPNIKLQVSVVHDVVGTPEQVWILRNRGIYPCPYRESNPGSQTGSPSLHKPTQPGSLTNNNRVKDFDNNFI